MYFGRESCNFSWWRFFTGRPHQKHQDELLHVDVHSCKEVVYYYKCRICGSSEVKEEAWVPLEDLKRKEQFIKTPEELARIYNN